MKVEKVVKMLSEEIIKNEIKKIYNNGYLYDDRLNDKI